MELATTQKSRFKEFSVRGTSCLYTLSYSSQREKFTYLGIMYAISSVPSIGAIGASFGMLKKIK